MLKTLLKTTPNLLKLYNHQVLHKYRTFLSQAYYCNESWKKRLESSLLQKVNLDELYYELDQSFQNTKNLSAIDVDVFANAVTDADHFGELRDLVYKLRLSSDCINMPKSTGHAVIRLLLEDGKHEDLLSLLDDRLNYGIFLDSFEANILMNKYIKDKQYVSAARVATQLMLQEDFTHDLATKLSALSCYLYLKNPGGWPEEAPPEPEPKEEIKVRVKFLRNPYFDDHFDLRNPNHLIGKTLTMIGKKGNDTLSNSLRVLGLGLHEKNDEALVFISKLTGGIYKEVGVLLEKNEVLKEAVNKVAVVEGDIQKELENFVKESVKKFEEVDIKNQKELYQKWESERMASLEMQKQRLLRIQRLEDVQNIQKDLQTQEQKLWFFENEDKLDLQIDSNKIYYRKRWFGKLKKSRKIDENYVPPEVTARRT